MGPKADSAGGASAVYPDRTDLEAATRGALPAYRMPGGPVPLLETRELEKHYLTGGRSVRLLQGLNFVLAPGELVAIIGQSGSGKSTLLHMLGALDAPSRGDVYFAATSLHTLSADAAAAFRNKEVGYVWQFHYLLPEFTAAENVAMPLLARGVGRREAMGKAEGWLERVGLRDRVKHRAGELSGGEQQRVSIARALVTEPRLLLADEPTGDLDSATADGIFSLIRELHRSQGLTTVLATHNMDLARGADRVMRLNAGRLDEISTAAV